MLETIAASGRVRFHEREEILFSADDSYDGHLRVIQQGSVRLTRPAKTQQQVVDLLGAGDILGLGRFLGRTAHEHTATTITDTVLYALDFKTFSRACADSPQATRFLQIHFAAAQVETGAIGMDVSSIPETAAEVVARPLVSCSADTPMVAAAALMRREQLDELLVVDAAVRPLGCLTAAGWRDFVATAESIPPDTRVSQFMLAPPPTVASGATVADCLMQLLRSGRRHCCVTMDGTADTAALGLLTERDLLLRHGDNPTVVVSALSQARSTEELAGTRRRVNALVQTGLKGFQNAEWHAGVVTEANRSLLRRLLELAAAATTAALGAAPGDFCLALVGEAGRGESLTPAAVEMILILDARAAKNQTWFASLAEDLAARLKSCGFAAPRSGLSPVQPACRVSLAEWGENFRQWIASPIEHNILQQLPLFDFAPVQADHPLSRELRQTVRDALAGHPNFIRLLANDCFENLPPLTIFEGYAVDAAGLQTEQLELQAHAIQPVVDVARVFQLATGDIAITSTLGRLTRAGEIHPGARRVFEQASRAFRIALTCGATVGLKTGSDGARIRPALLSRADQVLLKSGFQSIAALLEYAAQAHGFRR